MRAVFYLLGLLLAACSQRTSSDDENSVHVARSTLVWTAVANQMQSGRFQHAAATLGGGRVLVCGGRSFNPVTYYSLCEVYSAADNSFHKTADLAPSRAFFSLTATTPGHAIAVAGNNQVGGSVQYLSDAWRFDWDGNAGAWTQLGSVAPARRAQRSLWLPGQGNLLVTGGFTTSEVPVPGDLLTTASGWATLSPGISRVDHSLTLLEGTDRVLVVGGRTSDTDELGSVELFTTPSTTPPWTHLTAILPRYSHTATLIPSVTGGRKQGVLLAGGYRDPVELSQTTVLYDPSGAGSARDVAALQPGRAFHAAAWLHGKVIVTGGYTGTAALARVDVYDPELDVWYDLDPMQGARYDHTLTALDDDRLLVTGGRDLTTVGALTSGEVLRPKLQAETCDASRRECLSGHCVDGVCCESACDGTCQRCDAEGVCRTDVTGTPVGVRAACDGGYLCENGACLTRCTKDAQCDMSGYFCDGKHCVPRQAGSCTRDIECVAGLSCVDGFCCNSPCEGQCEACDKPEHEGTCTAIDGPVHGAREACAGGGGDCELRCDGTDRVACHYPQRGASCSQKRCVDGLEEHPGKCDGRGSCSDTPVLCVAFTCDAATATCGDTCSDDSQCLNGYFCQAGSCVVREGVGAPCVNDGACRSELVCEDAVCCVERCAADSTCDAEPGFCKKLLGADCRVDTQCASGHCVDQVCCESECSGQCETCALAEHPGECRPAMGDPVSPREPCDAGDGLCSASTCDGRDDHRASCAGWLHLDQICAEPACQDGRFVPGQSCNSDGLCAGGTPILCEPYACAAGGCLERCDADMDCATNFVCTENQCVPPGAHCVGESRVDDGRGKQTDCEDYRCVAGACLKSCASSADCAAGRACSAEGRCVSAALDSAPADDGCSCAVPGSASHRSGGLASLLVCALLVLRRRAQRRGGHPSISSSSSSSSELFGA